MLKEIQALKAPDPYFSGTTGFVGCTQEKLHQDMCKLELSTSVPENVRRSHDAIRHAYIYSYYSYDLLILAASQIFPCLEFALREHLGSEPHERVNKRGKSLQPTLRTLLQDAKKRGLVSSQVEHLTRLRNMYAHGTDTILNPPLFLLMVEHVTNIIQNLFDRGSACTIN